MTEVNKAALKGRCDEKSPLMNKNFPTRGQICYEKTVFGLVGLVASAIEVVTTGLSAGVIPGFSSLSPLENGLATAGLLVMDGVASTLLLHTLLSCRKNKETSSLVYEV